MPPSKHTFVVLLRGVNVGGHRKLPMADLRAMCIDSGATDVQTYIQSGNVVVATEAGATELVSALDARLTEYLGESIPLMIRTAAELGDLLANPPLDLSDRDVSKVVVLFHRDDVAATALDGVDLDGFAPERAYIVGSHIVLDLPEGQSRSKLAAAVARTEVGAQCTGRNWRTVEQLHSMAVPQQA